MTLKQCQDCHAEKPATVEFFHRSANRRDGLQPKCKPCNAAATVAWKVANPARHAQQLRRNQLRRKYGLTPETFDALLASQGGGCSICEVTTPGGRGAWHVDHDHACCPGERTCGKCIRGLLCSNCNLGLGYFRDSPDLLRRALAYLAVRNIQA